MSDALFHIRLADGLTFDSKEQFAAECGYSLSYIATLRKKGLGWQAIWNRKKNGTPAQRAKLRRKARKRPKDDGESLFEPVLE